MTIFQDNGYCRGEILSLYPADSTDECFNQIIHFFEKKERMSFHLGRSQNEKALFFEHIWLVSPNMSTILGQRLLR